MSLLSGLSTDDSIQNEVDTVGGGGGPLDSGAYLSTVTMAYLNKSKGGALGLNLHFKTNGAEFRQTLWITSGDAKGNKNFYMTQDGEKKYLPGFIHANALCLLTVGKELPAMDTETKIVKIYNPEAKAEVATEVEAIVDLIGEQIIVGLHKQIVDKRTRQDDGTYAASGETREENEIDKLFRADDGKTTAEIRAQADEAAFIHTWTEKWTGKVRDRSTKDAGKGRAGAPRQLGSAAAGAAAGAAAAPAGGSAPKSLFGR